MRTLKLHIALLLLTLLIGVMGFAQNRPPYGVITQHHSVQPNQTIESIARMYRVTPAFLKRWNGLNKNSVLKLNRKLIVGHFAEFKHLAPLGEDKNIVPLREVDVHYTVKQGDTIESIANETGQSFQSIIDWNNLSSMPVLKPGMRLITGHTFLVDWKMEERLRYELNRLKNPKTVTPERPKKLPRIQEVQPNPEKATTYEEEDNFYTPTKPNKPVADPEQDTSPYNLPSQSANDSKPYLEDNGSTASPSTPRESNRDVYVYHTFRRGESLFDIAEKHNISAEHLIKWNKLPAKGSIPNGKKLIVGFAESHLEKDMSSNPLSLKENISPDLAETIQEDKAKTSRKSKAEKDDEIEINKHQGFPYEDNDDFIESLEKDDQYSESSPDGFVQEINKVGDKNDLDLTDEEKANIKHGNSVIAGKKGQKQGSSNQDLSEAAVACSCWESFFPCLLPFFTGLLLFALLGYYLKKYIEDIQLQKTDAKRRHFRDILTDLSNNYISNQLKTDAFNDENHQKNIHLSKKSLQYLFAPYSIDESGKDRTALLAEMLDLHNSLEGNASELLEALYLILGFEEESFQNLTSDSWKKRQSGIIELSEMNIGESVAEITKLINDTNPNVRETARYSLSKLDKENPLVFLHQITHPLTASEEKRITEYLEQLAPADLPDFRQWFHATNSSVGVFAIKMVSKFKQKSAIPTLESFLVHPDEELQIEAVRAIGELGGTEYKEILHSLYANATPTIKLRILEAFEKLDITNLENLQIQDFKKEEDPNFLSAKYLLSTKIDSLK